MVRRDSSEAGFEPPPYLASLIAAINDGAKAAQAGALLLLLIGLYLLATAFSASDEDLLLGKVITISQIGASLPVTFSFAIAPVIFVFMHIYTLVRYDMLAANVRHFARRLQESIPLASYREDCLQLLANVEFVLALAAPRSSRVYSRAWSWLFWGIMAVFPVTMLLLVQVNSLRYQGDLINLTQRIWLVIDLAALAWFFSRNRLNGAARPETWLAKALRWANVLWLPTGVIALDLVYVNVVPAHADPRLVHYNPPKSYLELLQSSLDGRPKELNRYLTDVAAQPLDVTVCSWLNWGCRYLRVEHRTLVDKVWDEKMMPRFRYHDLSDLKLARANVEGLVLRDRSFRFAVLDGSRLYAVDLANADLQGASLKSADLTAANIQKTNLRNADLSFAVLNGASLDGANLDAANLSYANLDVAALTSTKLRGANLQNASLQGVILLLANLEFANLENAVLKGALIGNSNLRLANLAHAQLGGASIVESSLDGIEMRDADLRAVNIASTTLWHVSTGGLSRSTGRFRTIDVSLADLRNVDFETPLDKSKGEELRRILDAIPEGKIKDSGRSRLGEALSEKGPGFDFKARYLSVLVSDEKELPFADHPELLVVKGSPEFAKYREQLLRYLVEDLASSHAAIAQGIIMRGLDELDPSSESYFKLFKDDITLETSILCRLLGHPNTSGIKLDRKLIEDFRGGAIRILSASSYGQFRWEVLSGCEKIPTNSGNAK